MEEDFKADGIVEEIGMGKAIVELLETPQTFRAPLSWPSLLVCFSVVWCAYTSWRQNDVAFVQTNFLDI